MLTLEHAQRLENDVKNPGVSLSILFPWDRLSYWTSNSDGSQETTETPLLPHLPKHRSQTCPYPCLASFLNAEDSNLHSPAFTLSQLTISNYIFFYLVDCLLFSLLWRNFSLISYMPFCIFLLILRYYWENSLLFTLPK